MLGEAKIECRMVTKPLNELPSAFLMNVRLMAQPSIFLMNTSGWAARSSFPCSLHVAIVVLAVGYTAYLNRFADQIRRRARCDRRNGGGRNAGRHHSHPAPAGAANPVANDTQVDVPCPPKPEKQETASANQRRRFLFPTRRNPRNWTNDRAASRLISSQRRQNQITQSAASGRESDVQHEQRRRMASASAPTRRSASASAGMRR